MARIVFKQVNGIATERRFVKENYVLQPGEQEVPGDSLPSEEALSDPVAWAAAQAANTAKEQRRQTVRVEAEADNVVDKLRDATPAQITTFIQNQVTDLASARVVITKLAICLAYVLQGGRDK